MKKLFIISLLGICLLLGGCTTISQQKEELEKQKQELQEEKDSLEKEKEEFQQQKDELTKQQEELKNEQEELEKQKQALTEQQKQTEEVKQSNQLQKSEEIQDHSGELTEKDRIEIITIANLLDGKQNKNKQQWQDELLNIQKVYGYAYMKQYADKIINENN